MLRKVTNKFLILLTASVLIAGCSSTKEISTSSITQGDCTNQKQINNPSEFVSETAQNLDVVQRGDLITATIDVETYCNAQLSFDVVKNENEIKLKLKNDSGVKDNCVCTKNVSISLANVEPGDYNILVTNLSGSQLLAKATFTVK